MSLRPNLGLACTRLAERLAVASYTREDVTALVAVLSRTPRLKIIDLGWLFTASSAETCDDLVGALALCPEIREATFGAPLDAAAPLPIRWAAWPRLRSLELVDLAVTTSDGFGEEIGTLHLDGVQIGADVLRSLLARLTSLRALELTALSISLGELAAALQPRSPDLTGLSVALARRPDPADHAAFEVELGRMRSLIALVISSSLVRANCWLTLSLPELKAVSMCLGGPEEERMASLLSLSAAMVQGLNSKLKHVHLAYGQHARPSETVLDVFEVRRPATLRADMLKDRPIASRTQGSQNQSPGTKTTASGRSSGSAGAPDFRCSVRRCVHASARSLTLQSSVDGGYELAGAGRPGRPAQRARGNSRDGSASRSAGVGYSLHRPRSLPSY